MTIPASDQHVVLLVEDEALVRMMVDDALTDAGFRVIDAVNAAEAVELLEARSDVMVVISDIEMGAGPTGYELARTIHERWPGIGLILTSGRSMPFPGDLPSGSVFLAKPYPLATMIEQARQMAHRTAEATIITADEFAAPTNVVPLRAREA